MVLLPATLYAVTLPKVVPLPDFTVGGSTSPPYGINPNCSAGEVAIVFHLAIRNLGQGTSAAINDSHAVWVQDNANPSWAGGATLPAIPASGGVVVNVPLLGLKSQDAMAGHHQFTATVNGTRSVAELAYNNNSLVIGVDFPPGFCGPIVSTTTVSSTTVTPRSTTPPRGAQAPPPIFGSIPAPTNLTLTTRPDVCAKYGGPAASLACTAAFPAGKLVLVWDYPFPNAVDGFHVYTTKSGGSPVATQTTPGVRLAILDPGPVGTCYVVTAFQGTKVSQQSASSFCVQANNLTKTSTFTSDMSATMIIDAFIWVGKSLSEDTSNLRGYADLLVGSGHEAALWRDLAHTQVSRYTNSVYRPYVHFDLTSLAGHTIVKAWLQLHGGSSQGNPSLACFSQYGAAPPFHENPPPDIVGQRFGGSRLQGPDVDLDVTPVVQSWAHSPGAYTAFVLRDDTGLSLAELANLTQTCVTSYKSKTLKVVYY
ncbi:MAG TPA: hypothetical protein VJ853_05030 [Thermoanaerobaculia bacterium]|nr:hypothetical protein [Thermoanaerobaculia bacterium]